MVNEQPEIFLQDTKAGNPPLLQEKKEAKKEEKMKDI